MTYMVNSILFSGISKLIRELNAEPASLFTKFGVPVDIEDKTDVYVPFTNTALLLEYCAQELNCPDFGLRLSQVQGLPILGPVAVLARNAATVDAALRSISDYLHLVTPAISARFEMHLEDQCIRAFFTLLETGLFPTRQIYELYMGNGQLIVHMLLGSKVFADTMYFPHARAASAKTYRQLFKCDVRFEQDFCAVDLPISIMNQQIEQADKETARIASDYLADRYGGNTASLHEQVIHLINRLLPTGLCKINLVAEQLSMHPRTLQRRLANEDHHFEQLVDQQRKLLAQRYLSESNLQFTQVTGLLGYSDQSALNRSCKRWFNQTPKTLRKHYAKVDQGDVSK